ncbi:MAG TPA: hypothetical protein VKK31_22270 [Thermoanaerobaculia bacterium]|nr:hypothetical protein [Thermoanaerobaculia bacterium]
METARIGSRRQRAELASIFCRFSGGWFLVSRQERTSTEIDSALRTRLGCEPAGGSIFSVFTREMLLAFGDYPLLSTLLDRSPEQILSLAKKMGPFLSLISYLEFEDEHVRRQAIERVTAMNRELIRGMLERREQLIGSSKEMRRRVYSVTLFSQMYDKIYASVLRLGGTLESLRSLTAEQLTTIIDDVPCFDIECRLAVKLEQQAKKVEENDVFDIAALTAAVPYFDAVVTESFWVNLCKQSGVSSKYSARLFSSLFQVCDWLKRGNA